MGCCNTKLKIPNSNFYYPSFNHELKYESFIFNFSTKTVSPVPPNTIVEFSSFGLAGLSDSYDNIKKLKNIKDVYILCPVYWQKNERKDTQLAVTGTNIIGENYDDCVIREIAEELGVTVSKYYLNYMNTKIDNGNNEKKRTILNYNVNLSYTRPYDPYDKFYIGKDDFSKKIQVVPFGDLSNLLNLIKKITLRPYSDDIKLIREIRLISLKEF